jgi:serine/threonine protein kinase
MEINLKDYLKENGSLKGKLDLFKNIVLSLAEALSTIYQKGVIHRDINPHNVYIKSLEDENKIIKLGNFSSSTYKKDNISESIGSIYYSAPEIIKNLKYDEKCDLWSLGITLYEIYFGELPYGSECSPFSIKKAIYDEKNFKFKKTNIPTLDILFKRLLTINPKNRMDYNEFFQWSNIFSMYSISL